MFVYGRDNYTEEGWKNNPHIGEYMANVERGGNWYKFSMRFHWDEKDVVENFFMNLLKSFKFMSGPMGFQFCPSQWIDNQMPTVREPAMPRQYFIFNDKRMELSEFDLGWVRKNCNIEPQKVY